MDYEAPVFAWLADYALNEYDKVIEIGANVGIYTVFLDALINRTLASRLRKIVAFEPSQIPYRRLLENIYANRSQHVDVFQAAVGIKSGFQPFFEPAGHLTNGSFLRDFAGIFADAVSETTVLVVGAQKLEPYFMLFKIISGNNTSLGMERQVKAAAQHVSSKRSLPRILPFSFGESRQFELRALGRGDNLLDFGTKALCQVADDLSYQDLGSRRPSRHTRRVHPVEEGAL